MGGDVSAKPGAMNKETNEPFHPVMEDFFGFA